MSKILSSKMKEKIEEFIPKNLQKRFIWNYLHSNSEESAISTRTNYALLMYSFDWENTPEGYFFWLSLYEKMVSESSKNKRV
jgi:hypothetical protein